MKYIIWFLLFIACNGEKSLKVDIYPGYGWDHLRFLDMSPIYDVSNFNDSNLFQSCIEMLPLHENKIEIGSTVIDAFDSRTSDYSSNFMIGGNAGFSKFKLGGSFSKEYQTIKKEQGEQKSITLRNQIDYLMVDVILKSSCPLNPEVKRDIIKIAEYQTTDQSLMATYAAQIFVKKYGTHFTSRLYLGGSFAEEDFIAHANYYSIGSDKTLYKAAAEASFLKTFSLSGNYSSIRNQTTTNKYTEQIIRKVVSSKGGDVFILGGHMEAWQASIKQSPAIIRRGMENITYFIQSDKIPELTAMALTQVRQKINDAVETYVEMNTIRGCMKRESSSFNWVANVDDSSCASADQTMQFGGFILTCWEDDNLPQTCTAQQRDNYYTNTNQCPYGFKQYPLHISTQTEKIYKRKCESCGFLWLDTCCQNEYIGEGRRQLVLYGCNRDVKGTLGIDLDKTYLFGGSFTSTKVNPVTNAFTCPEGFMVAYQINGITVCLAERIAASSRLLPRYGGMYTCQYGNIGIDTRSKTCPRGYSAYPMGSLQGNCLFEVCLKFEKFDDVRELPPVALPPFFSIDTIDEIIETNATNESNETNETYTINVRILGDPHKAEARSSNVQSSTVSGSRKLELGLSAGALFIAITAVTIIGVFQMKKYRRRRRRMTRRDDVNNIDLAVIKT